MFLTDLLMRSHETYEIITHEFLSLRLQATLYVASNLFLILYDTMLFAVVKS